MAKNQIRSLDFLPEVFQTETNKQFLSATLDVLTQQPNMTRVQGYIGAKYGYAIDPSDKYVQEPTKVRSDYQLEPAVAFLKTDTQVAEDFIDYPGIIDALRAQYGATDDHNKLFSNKFYSWDSFTNLDKLVNFSQYHWLPLGPDAIQIDKDIDISDILGQKSFEIVYTTSLTLKFLNGLKVNFTGNVTPAEYANKDYYVEGVGSSIKLVPAKDMLCTEITGGGIYIPWDNNPWDTTDWSLSLYVPLQPDYLVVNRGSDDRNAWARGNRWFHQAVIDEVTTFNGQVTTNIYNIQSRAKRPIIEFEPNLQMFNMGSKSAGIVHFVDTETTDAMSTVAGTEKYIARSSFHRTSIRITDKGIVLNDIEYLTEGSAITCNKSITHSSGTIAAGSTLYITEIDNVQRTIQVTNVRTPTQDSYTLGNQLILTEDAESRTFTIVSEIGVLSDATVIFANDSDERVRGKVFKISFVQASSNSLKKVISLTPVAGLSLTTADTVAVGTQSAIALGPGENKGSTWRYDYNMSTSRFEWIECQKKVAINQAPIFDLFDVNGSSLGDSSFYPYTSFSGTSLFSYASGEGDADTILGFAVAYSSSGNSSDFKFDVNLNSDSFTYNDATGKTVTQKISEGYIHDYTTGSVVQRTGWVEATAPSTQYQAIIKDIDTVNTSATSKLVGRSGTTKLLLKDTNNIKKSTFVYGPNVESGTKVLDVSGNVVTIDIALSGDATGTYTFEMDQYTTAVVGLKGNNVIDINDSEIIVEIGQRIVGYGIPSNSVITAIEHKYVTDVNGKKVVSGHIVTIGNTNGLSVILTANTTGEYKLTHQYTESTSYDAASNKSTTLVLVNTQGIKPHHAVTGIGVETLTHVVSVDANTVTLSQAITEVGSGDYTFREPDIMCDVLVKSVEETVWAPVKIYKNGDFVNTTEYEITTDKVSRTTGITFATVPAAGDQYSVLILSDDVSKTGYYQVPTNLQSNPFNDQIEYVTGGDLKRYYTSIYTNIPGAVGTLFGLNNIDTLGALSQYSNTIIQNSASLLLPGMFLRKSETSLATSLQYSSDEYSTYKAQLVDITNAGDYSIYQSAADILDDVIYQIVSTKTESGSFYWSDMMPVGSPYSSKSYTFNADVTSAVYQLTLDYSYTEANYRGLAVYHTEEINGRSRTTQLVRGVDYTVNATEKTVLVQRNLTQGSTVTVKEYNQTWGSFIPNTPTKLGLYTATKPEIVLDKSFIVPTYFILGHDGSYTRLYGEYKDGYLVDFRDIVLLEFETRIYNNLKLDGNEIPLRDTDVFPGEWRNTGFDLEEVMPAYSNAFLSWVGKNRLPDFRRQIYIRNNQFTYNYSKSTNKNTGKLLKQGNWRGIYRWLFDTTNPADAPWEILGFTNKPTWWDAKYGAAPYTSKNEVMWTDIANGYIWNGSDADAYVDATRVRKGQLLDVATASIEGKVLTITASKFEGLAVGTYILGPGIIPGTKIESIISGSGGIGQYNITIAHTLSQREIEVRDSLGLLGSIPVDRDGNLIPPMESVVGNYDSLTFEKSWMIGDGGPTESAYLRSSAWPFDLMRILSVFRPVQFYNYTADRDTYKYDDTLKQYVYNKRYRLDPRKLSVYGSGTAKHSFMNWVVDYINRTGKDGHTYVANLLTNVDVRLSYKIAGFSDKQFLRFLNENTSPASTGANLLIPDDSYEVLLYDSVPTQRIAYSSVIVQKTTNGYTIWGNSTTNPYFRVANPKVGPMERITVNKTTVELSSMYDVGSESTVAYATEFYTITGVAEFLRNYGRWLVDNGVVFENSRGVDVISWDLMIREFLNWAEQSWETGSTVSLNPNARTFKIYKPGQVVQPLTLRDKNFILNQNLVPLSAEEYTVIRENEEFVIKILNEGDTVAYTNLNLSTVEHAVIFDNETIFGDTIYKPVSGLRQARMIVQGKKTADWNGYVNATGFILNQSDIQEWNSSTKYPKGQIVLYKNLYWFATTQIEPSDTFDYTLWVQSSYDNIKKGLLPNPSTIAYESSALYDSQQANLEQDEDLLAFGLIGFRPRFYLADAALTDVSQVNIYKNLLKAKGTNQAAYVFKGASPLQGDLDYDVRENWALKVGDFGATLNSNFVEVKLDKSKLSGNPSVIGFGDLVSSTTNYTTVTVPATAHQKVAVGDLTLRAKAERGDVNYINYKYQNDLINYSRPPESAAFLPPYPVSYTDGRGIPTAGYVNVDDTNFQAFAIENLNLDTSLVDKLYRGDVIWIASHKNTWDILTPVSVGTQLLGAVNQNNGTAVLHYADQHGLTTGDYIAVVGFGSTLNGFYEVQSTPSLKSATVTLTMTEAKVFGAGVTFKLNSMRASQASDFANISTHIQYSEFATQLRWVDDDSTGNWAVYSVGPQYEFTALTYADQVTSLSNFATSVAYTSSLGVLTVAGGALYKDGVAVTGVTIADSANAQIAVAGNTVYVTDPSANTIHTTTTITPIVATGITGPLAVSQDGVWLYATTTAGVDVFFNNVKVNTIAAPLSNIRFGASLATAKDGSKLFVGAPDEAGELGAEEGAVYVYDRATRAILQTSSTTIFTVTPAIPGAVAQVLVNADKQTTGVTVNANANANANATDVEFTTAPAIGSTIYINYGALVLQQKLVSSNPHIGANFGQSVATNRYGAELLVGAPYELSTVNGTKNVEGAVYRFTNVGQRYGQITASVSRAAGTSVSGTLYIDGFAVSYNSALTTYDAAMSDANITITPRNRVAYQINLIEPTNVLADYSDSTDEIKLYNRPGTSVVAFDQLDIVGATEADLTTLKITSYKKTQVIYDHSLDSNSQFGWSVAMNQNSSVVDSVVISAPAVDSYSDTTFDFTNDLNADNDTWFDNGATTFVDKFEFRGAVYQYDYLPSSSESSEEPGAYAFAQYCNIPVSSVEQEATRSNKPYYGVALAVNDGSIVVGTPGWYKNGSGRIAKFTTTVTNSAWDKKRSPLSPVDVNKLNTVAIYDTLTNKTIERLDYIDPAQGKMLSAIELNIDIIGRTDPAVYTSGMVWGATQVGRTWLDTTNIRLMNYNQDDVAYNAKYFGQTFPGSMADIYTWVSSSVAPQSYSGSGYVTDTSKYTTATVYDHSSNSLKTVYYFWVKYSDEVPAGKSISPLALSDYILDPLSSGIAYMGAISTNSVALFNAENLIEDGTSALHFCYETGDNGDQGHQHWVLIQDGEETSFLSGVPKSTLGEPEGMYLKYLTSFMGVDRQFKTVPDMTLPELNRYGVSFRPRQSMFIDRKTALKNYIQYANQKAAATTTVETRGLFLLNQKQYLNMSVATANTTKLYVTLDSGIDVTDLYVEQPIKFEGTEFGGLRQGTTYYIVANSTTGLAISTDSTGQYIQVSTSIRGSALSVTATGSMSLRVYDTTDYWTKTYWWADGYSAKTKINIEVATYTDLERLAAGGALFVSNSGNTTLGEGTIARIAKNGQGVNEVYAYSSTTGWTRVGLQDGTIELSSALYTEEAPIPSTEIMYVLRWITEQLYTSELSAENNTALIMMFNYIQSESLQDQNYLTWLNKTSLIDVKHTIRQLVPYKKYQRDANELVHGYLEEIKPYHVYIKDFSYNYDGYDYYEGTFTDFDLPSKYNATTGKFSTPQLVYKTEQAGDDAYLPTDAIWSQSIYKDWAQYVGLSISAVTQSNGILVTNLAEDITNSTVYIKLSETAVLPEQGTLILNDGSKTEEIRYYNVNRFTNIISNVQRATDFVKPSAFAAGTQVYLIPETVMVMDSGRGYTTAPIISAYFDETNYPYGVRTPAEFLPVLNEGKLKSVQVVNAGSGYPVVPEVRVSQSSIKAQIQDTQVDTVLNQFYSAGHDFIDGDVISVSAVKDDSTTTALKNGAYYYVKSISENVIALYENFKDVSRGYTSEEIVYNFKRVAGSSTQATVLVEVTRDNVRFKSGDKVNVSDSNAPGIGKYYYVESLGMDDYSSPFARQKVAIYETYEDLVSGDTTKRVAFEYLGTIRQQPTTDAKRVNLAETDKVSATLAITARVKVFTDNLPTREMKIGMKFDRTSYFSQAAEYNKDTLYNETSMVVVDDVLYKFNAEDIKIAGRTVADAAALQFGKTFESRWWIKVDINESNLNALDRVAGFYKPTAEMPGFAVGNGNTKDPYSTTDMTQLMSGTKFPYQTVTDEAFNTSDKPESYVFVPNQVVLSNNTVKLYSTVACVATYQESISSSDTVSDVLVVEGMATVNKVANGIGGIATFHMSSNETKITVNARIRFLTDDLGGSKINLYTGETSKSGNANNWGEQVYTVANKLTANTFTLTNSTGTAVQYTHIQPDLPENATTAQINALANSFTGYSTIQIDNSIRKTIVSFDATDDTVTLSGILNIAVNAVFYINHTNANSNDVIGGLYTGQKYYVKSITGQKISLKPTIDSTDTVAITTITNAELITYGDLYASITPYTTYSGIATSSTKFATGDIARIEYSAPASITTQFLFVRVSDTSRISLHPTITDARNNARAIAIEAGAQGRLVKPQTVLSLGEKISSSVGVINALFSSSRPQSNFGLVSGQRYWIALPDATSTSDEAAFYYTKDDAENAGANDNRIPLLTQSSGQLSLIEYDTLLNGNTNNAAYDIVGTKFEYGYGPEELVAGVTLDGVNITVTTKPGATWNPRDAIVGTTNKSDTFSHTGFNIVRLKNLKIADVLSDDGQPLRDSSGNKVVGLSFKNATVNPTTIHVFFTPSTDQSKKFRVTPDNYVINWIDQYIVITIDTLLIDEDLDRFEIAIYEVGNGNQVIRGNTNRYPLRKVLNDGSLTDYHSEIYLGIPYAEIDIPSASNYWLSAVVFMANKNGRKEVRTTDAITGVTTTTYVPSTDTQRMVYITNITSPEYSTAPRYSIETVRPYDPINDPYNPAKIVFEHEYDLEQYHIVFSLTTSVLGFFVVDNLYIEDKTSVLFNGKYRGRKQTAQKQLVYRVPAVQVSVIDDMDIYKNDLSLLYKGLDFVVAEVGDAEYVKDFITITVSSDSVEVGDTIKFVNKTSYGLSTPLTEYFPLSTGSETTNYETVNTALGSVNFTFATLPNVSYFTCTTTILKDDDANLPSDYYTRVLISDVSTPWSATEIYSLGDDVNYNDIYYRCVKDGSQGKNPSENVVEGSGQTRGTDWEKSSGIIQVKNDSNNWVNYLGTATFKVTDTNKTNQFRLDSSAIQLIADADSGTPSSVEFYGRTFTWIRYEKIVRKKFTLANFLGDDNYSGLSIHSFGFDGTAVDEEGFLHLDSTVAISENTTFTITGELAKGTGYATIAGYASPKKYYVAHDAVDGAPQIVGNTFTAPNGIVYYTGYIKVKLSSYFGGKPDVTISSGIIQGITISADAGMIIELAESTSTRFPVAARYDGPAPVQVYRKIIQVKDELKVSYPAPVYGIAGFSVTYFTVQINGIDIPQVNAATGRVNWNVNYDFDNGRFAQFDSDFLNINLAVEWDANTSYIKGTICKIGTDYYKAKNDITGAAGNVSPATNTTDWVKGTDAYDYWSPSRSYAVGAKIAYAVGPDFFDADSITDSQIRYFKCNTAINLTTAVAWTWAAAGDTGNPSYPADTLVYYDTAEQGRVYYTATDASSNRQTTPDSDSNNWATIPTPNKDSRWSDITDSEFNLLDSFGGFFDDGTPFDNQASFNIVFNALDWEGTGADVIRLHENDIVTLTYQVPGEIPPEMYTITANADKIGGEINVLASGVGADATGLLVTTFGRTTQQSLVTQRITDATVSVIESLTFVNVGGKILPLVTTTANHSLVSGHKVILTGDINKFGVEITDAYNKGTKIIDITDKVFWVSIAAPNNTTVSDINKQFYLYNNAENTSFYSGPANATINGASSFVQLLDNGRTDIPVNRLVLDQPYFTLYDEDRMIVSVVKNNGARYYIGSDNMRLVNYNGNNTLLLKERIDPADQLLITSVVPSVTPAVTKFRMNNSWDRISNRQLTPTIHRENQFTRTFITELQKDDTGAVTAFRVQNPFALVTNVDFSGSHPLNGTRRIYYDYELGQYYVILNKIDISQVVYVRAYTPKYTPARFVGATQVSPAVTKDAVPINMGYGWVGIKNSTTLKVVFEGNPGYVSEADHGYVDITVSFGSTVLIDSEKVKYSYIELSTIHENYGWATGLIRGRDVSFSNDINQTSTTNSYGEHIAVYDEVQSILLENKMSPQNATSWWYDTKITNNKVQAITSSSVSVGFTDTVDDVTGETILDKIKTVAKDELISITDGGSNRFAVWLNGLTTTLANAVYTGTLPEVKSCGNGVFRVANAGNIKYVLPGAKMKLYSASGAAVNYTNLETKEDTNVFTVVGSHQDTEDSTLWVLEVAETSSVFKNKGDIKQYFINVEVLTDFIVTDVSKPTTIQKTVNVTNASGVSTATLVNIPVITLTYDKLASQADCLLSFTSNQSTMKGVKVLTRTNNMPLQISSGESADFLNASVRKTS